MDASALRWISFVVAEQALHIFGRPAPHHFNRRSNLINLTGKYFSLASVGDQVH
jgi:hypothetical protein